jgi:peroxiredoxin
MIGFGVPLAALAMIVIGGALLSYVAKMRRNRSDLRPVNEQLAAAAAILLATAAFFQQPGILGALIAVVAIVPAGLFLVAIYTSREPAQPPNMHIGELAPDFAGVAADGTPFRLSALRGQPVLLKFFRGLWCPYCIAELKELAALAPNFEALGVKLVAVSSDSPVEIARVEARRRWPIALVADQSLEAHRSYNVQRRHFAPRRGPFRELAIPTTVLIGADGRVQWFVQSRDHRVRPHADWVLGMIIPFLSKRPRPALAA